MNHLIVEVVPMDPMLEPADLFLTRGKSLVSRMIRFFTRTMGERRTLVNHVGIVVEGGSLRDAVVVEALATVKRHRLWDRYGPPGDDSVAIYRATNLTPEEIELIVSDANSQVGKRYGYFKIVAHLIDWLFLGAYVFRRIARSGNYPICSWLVADAFSKAGKHFGVQPGAATPDDIWDFILSHPQIYQLIHPLKPLS